MSEAMTEVQMAEVEKLKQLAIERYNDDHGVMHECSDNADYERMIKEDGTAEKAWALHIGIVDAQRETQACYDIDPKEGW